jgi:hypothetical protein
MIPSSMCLLFSYIENIVQLSIVMPATFVTPSIILLIIV